jgi:hypothetical protein
MMEMIRLGPFVKPKVKVKAINIGIPTNTKTSNKGGSTNAKPNREGFSTLFAREPSLSDLLILEGTT